LAGLEAGRLTAPEPLAGIDHDNTQGVLQIVFVSVVAGLLDLDIANDAAEAGDAFMGALELIRLRQAEEMQRDVRELLDGISEWAADG